MGVSCNWFPLVSFQTRPKGGPQKRVDYEQTQLSPSQLTSLGFGEILSRNGTLARFVFFLFFLVSLADKLMALGFTGSNRLPVTSIDKASGPPNLEESVEAAVIYCLNQALGHPGLSI